ncbi:hypothetical protein [Hymenobacter ruber]
MKILFTRESHKENPLTGAAPIYLRITLGFGPDRPGKRREGMRREVATGVLTKAAEWDQDAQKVRGNSARAALSNGQLTDWKQAADEFYRTLKKDNPNVTAEDVKLALKPRALAAQAGPALTVAQGLALFLEHMDGQGIGKSANTRLTYRTRATNLGLFFADYTKQLAAEQGRSIPKGAAFPLEEVKLPVGRALERWCLANNPATGQPRFGHVAMRKQVNMLQMVVSHAAMEGLVPANALHGYKYQSTPEPTVPRFLTTDDLSALRAAVFVDDHLNAVKDMFLFCVSTGLSYVDYVAFTKSPGKYLFQEATMIQGRPVPLVWLRMTRQKMRKRKADGFSVQLFDEAAGILVKRRGRLPVRLNANANRYLKDIAAELGLSLPDLTFKDARSTFAQHWRDRGVSSAVIAAMMGNTERMVNKEYSSVREATIVQAMGAHLLGPDDSPLHRAA